LRYGFIIALIVIVLGFGLAFYKAHLEAGPQVDVDAIIEKLEASHAGELKALGDQHREELKDWKEQATKAVSALASLRGQPDAPPGIEKALEFLKQGRTQAAEAIFLEVEERKAAEGKAANKEAAEAARHRGALAFLHDTEKALQAYRRAVELDPENPIGWNRLGGLLQRKGELREAESAYRKVAELGESSGNRTVLAIAYGNLGNVYRIRGELDEAEAMHQKALAISETLGHKGYTASIYANLAIVYEIRGELDEAEAMYQKALAISEALGSKEGMAITYANQGIVYQLRGELDAAEAMHQKALALHDTHHHNARRTSPVPGSRTRGACETGLLPLHAPHCRLCRPLLRN